MYYYIDNSYDKKISLSHFQKYVEACTEYNKDINLIKNIPNRKNQGYFCMENRLDSKEYYAREGDSPRNWMVGWVVGWLVAAVIPGNI